MGVEGSRFRGQKLSGGGKEYCGIAVATHECIVSTGARIVDTRELWCGHVDIILPHKRRRSVVAPGEPVALDGSEAAENNKVANALKSLFTYVPDGELEEKWASTVTC